MKLTLISAALLPAFSMAAPACPHNCSPKPPAFFLAGDSTTATQSPGGGGWGDGFLSFLEAPAFGTNYGRNGRTTVDFVTGGHWALVTAAAANATATHDVYVTIQFGHNDQKPDKNISLAEYQANLGRLAGEIKALGATPILVTPLTRRNFRAEHETDDSLHDERLRTIAAAEETDTRFIDLYANSKAFVEAIGEAASHEYNLKEGDNTHLSAEGGRVFGTLVADLMTAKDACLTPWIAQDEALSEEIWNAIGGKS